MSFVYFWLKAEIQVEEFTNLLPGERKINVKKSCKSLEMDAEIEELKCWWILIIIHSLSRVTDHLKNHLTLANAESRRSFCTICCNKSVCGFQKFNFLSFVTDLAAIRKILENENSGGLSCPSCKLPFDKGKKRKLIDTCGHQKCYSCMFKNESCSICANSQRQLRQDAQRETSTGKLRSTRNVNWSFVVLQFLRNFARFYEFTSLMIIYAIVNCKWPKISIIWMCIKVSFMSVSFYDKIEGRVDRL